MTPFTKFSQVKPILDKAMNSNDTRYYVKNLSGSKSFNKTHVYVYKGLIIDVIPDSDLISSLTIF